MQTQDFTNVLNSASIESEMRRLNKGLQFKKDDEVLKEMVAVEKSNNEHLAEKNLPDYLRTPTADELVEIRQFAIDLKKANKAMSKRQIRKSTQNIST